MNLLVAWRNIWRNPRRTLVIMTAIVIGVWNMVFLSALMHGIVVAMIENGVSTMTGDVQIHRKGYRKDPVVENSMNKPDEVTEVLERALPPGSLWASRVRVGAVASNARFSSGITMVGIDPAEEAEISFIGPDTVVEGRYLEEEDEHGIIVGKALVDDFETRLGHKLVLMTQDVDKEIASRSFRIIGIYRAEMQATEKQFAFVNRSAAEKLLGLTGGISEISIRLRDHEAAGKVAENLAASLSDDYEIAPWREMLPFLDAYLRINQGFTLIWYIVVFVAMGFGIVNTTLMAVFERMREFGLLKALGMKPLWIVRDVLTESVFLLVMGMTVGTALGLLSCWALKDTGIDLTAMAAGMEYFGLARVIYPVVTLKDVLTANTVVLVLGLLVSLYPAVKAARFTPVEALARN